MNKIKRYLENHQGATIEDYNNQRHRMHVIQASSFYNSKHVGNKSKKQLLALISHSISSFTKQFDKTTNRNGYIV